MSLNSNAFHSKSPSFLLCTHILVPRVSQQYRLQQQESFSPTHALIPRASLTCGGDLTEVLAHRLHGPKAGAALQHTAGVDGGGGGHGNAGDAGPYRCA